MSGLQAGSEDSINGVDVREQGSALRVATNTPHLVSLGTGRLSTAVTLHPIKQGRVNIGSDPTCDIYVVGTGVAGVHCRVENSHGVVTLYPVNGSTLVDGLPVDKPTRLSQGSMLTIGRSNYLRFNHPEEAKLMKSVLPSAHVSMAPVQYQPNENFASPSGYPNHQEQRYQNPQKVYKDITQLDQELDRTLKNVQRNKPPVAPRKYKDDLSDSDQEKPKVSSIMAKVSKFEYYAKQQKLGKSQFYTNEEISPKVFSSNSLTVNTPAKDVLGGRNLPNYMRAKNEQKTIVLNENNIVDPKSCSYANVAIKNKNKIEDIVRNFDENSRKELPKKVNNDQQNIYGKINQNYEHSRCNITTSFLNELPSNMRDHSRSQPNNLEQSRIQQNSLEHSRNQQNNVEHSRSEYGRIMKPCLPSPAFDRNPKYSPTYSNITFDRNMDAETKRIQAYQERINEEEQKEAEAARLEEILSMCAEYERQVAAGVPLTPTEKRPHNKIITNGSLPRSVVLTNPNFVQTSEGYYKFDTSQNRNNSMSKSLPNQRNLSSYENYDSSNSFTEEKTPEVTILNQSYEGRMDEIGIPVFENELSSPVMIRKYQNDTKVPLQSPIGSPYENVYRNNMGYKPKSPSSQSPRTRIKTTFAHKNLPSPQYFVFPTPPPVDNSKKPDFSIPSHNCNAHVEEHHKNNMTKDNKPRSIDIKDNRDNKGKENNVDVKTKDNNDCENYIMGGIEKQLSLEEEIPMIDDDLTNEIEFRVSKIIEKPKDNEESTAENKVSNENIETIKPELELFAHSPTKVETKNPPDNILTKNKSFDDVKKELMADIPELEEFENDLKQSKRDKLIKHITEDIKTMDIEADSIDGSILDFNLEELREKHVKLKDERKKLLAEIHEIKCKMTEIRSQGDDILRELEMEKALIKGEYDSEIAILKIEQKKKQELLERTRQVEEEIKQMKEKQDAKQSEMRERVEVATLKVERLEKDVKVEKSTLEELQNAQDILDNESKLCEDLEFQYLEEESELLAKREYLQNEYEALNKKLTAQKSRILNLNSEANNNLTSALEETKILQAEYVRLLNTVEELTGKVQTIEREIKPIVTKLNEVERTQSPDSAFFTDQTRAKSGEYGYSPQSSDSDELDLSKLINFDTNIKDKFHSIDQMSQSMIVDIERRIITDVIDTDESPTKKEKKGFWERNFDSLKRKNKDKKPKSPEKVDIMSQSLNENMFYNNENIETELPFDKLNSLRNSKKKSNGSVKSNAPSKIPTFAALGKIIKKDSFGRKSRENSIKEDSPENKNRYIKNAKQSTENKYKPKLPEKTIEEKQSHLEIEEKITNLNENSDLSNRSFEEPTRKDSTKKEPRIVHRKSCGDEPNLRNSLSELKKISDSGKIPSQDDIDRISKVTMDAPILSSDADMNTLGKRTMDSLMEIERKRIEMLEEQGCQVIENEREKISELKKRAQDEAKKLCDQKYREKSVDSDSCHFSGDFDRSTQGFDKSVAKDCSADDFYMTNSAFYEESSGLTASSIEELQVRNSRTESTEDDKRSDDSRPLSNASDFSRDNILSGAPRRSRRGIAPYSESQRPLTRYLPQDRDDFDLRRHVICAGHQIDLCPYVSITPSSCRGYLHKLGAKFHTWSKRWFVFDRESKTFVYYWDKSEKKPRGGAYFQVIEEVYLDHGNTSKSPNPQTTFIVKTRQRRYYLMAPSGEAARIWIDVIFTGAQGYMDYME